MQEAAEAPELHWQPDLQLAAPAQVQYPASQAFLQACIHRSLSGNSLRAHAWPLMDSAVGMGPVWEGDASHAVQTLGAPAGYLPA